MTDQPVLPGMEPEEDDVVALGEELMREFRVNGYSLRYKQLGDKHRAAQKRARYREILDFDPNSENDNMPQFASYCPSRSGNSFKMHSRWHHATRAAKMHDGAVYKWNGIANRWFRWEVWFEQEMIES